MSECPSVAAERFIADQEMPEECPLCGDPNANEYSGEPMVPEDPAFCSTHCRDAYIQEQRERDGAMAEDIQETAKLITAHNAQCPRCIDSKKYCFHQEG
jgi:hypothetical protein